MLRTLKGTLSVRTGTCSVTRIRCTHYGGKCETVKEILVAKRGTVESDDLMARRHPDYPMTPCKLGVFLSKKIFVLFLRRTYLEHEESSNFPGIRYLDFTNGKSFPCH